MVIKSLKIGHIGFMCRPSLIRGEKTFAVIRKRDVESRFCRILDYNKDKSILQATEYANKGQVWLIATSCNANGVPNLKYVYHDEQLNADREKYRELIDMVENYRAAYRAAHEE